MPLKNFVLVIGALGAVAGIAAVVATSARQLPPAGLGRQVR